MFLEMIEVVLDMKLMTLNLNTYQEDMQIEKFNRIAEMIVKEDIDIICFCEAAQTFMSPRVDEYVREDNAVKLICDAVNHLLGKTVYHFVWDLSHYGFKIYEEGIALMSKHPMSQVASQYVSHTHDIFTFKSRKVIKATIDYHGLNIDVYSCQLGWADDEYEPFCDQFERLDEWVREESPDRFVILAGDFSNDVKTQAYQQVIEAKYIDQYVLANPQGLNDETFIYPIGFDTANVSQCLRLDYVFANQKGYPVTSAKRLFMDDLRVSDHMAILVEWQMASYDRAEE